jgi:hypothetical protein
VFDDVAMIVLRVASVLAVGPLLFSSEQTAE